VLDNYLTDMIFDDSFYLGARDLHYIRFRVSSMYLGHIVVMLIPCFNTCI